MPPYSEHLSSLRVSGWEIPTALTLPTPLEQDVESGVLLIPGSLFSDVNGDYPAWNSFPHVYAHLAHKLSALGHAVFRFAKLGPGTGSVPVDAELAATTRTWEGRSIIASAMLDAMRLALDEQDLHPRRVIVAGHSEGSVVASRLAVSAHGESLDGVVLLAGPSIGILGIMREQIGFGLEPEQIDEVRARLDTVIGHIRRGEPIPAELGNGPGMGIGALVSMPDEGRRYMRDVDASDPLELARSMTQRTLVVQGGTDRSVPAHHGEALRDALRSRGGGESNTSYLFVPDVTHMFKVVPPDVTGPDAFGYPGETDPRVTDGIDEWIRRVTPTLAQKVSRP
jgi:pimeloyl-ACP methyl ester carboxylesterase